MSTNRPGRTGLGWSWVFVALLAFAGCQPTDPVEKVAAARARYNATLNGFVARPVVDPMAEASVEEEVVEGGEADGTAADAEAEDSGVDDSPTEGEEIGEILSLEPPRSNVLLDILVQHDLSDPLPGITLDISMVEMPSEASKGEWRVWVETAQLLKATPLQFSYTLEDVDYRDGDAFAVEIRSDIPAAELGEYREFTVGE